MILDALGHGEHKTISLVGTTRNPMGRPIAEDENQKVVAQEDVLGDVLVSVNGDESKLLL